MKCVYVCHFGCTRMNSLRIRKTIELNWFAQKEKNEQKCTKKKKPHKIYAKNLQRNDSKEYNDEDDADDESSSNNKHHKRLLNVRRTHRHKWKESTQNIMKCIPKTAKQENTHKKRKKWKEKEMSIIWKSIKCKCKVHINYYLRAAGTVRKWKEESRWQHPIVTIKSPGNHQQTTYFAVFTDNV